MHRGIKTLLWGNSVALSWMWGLGLFFSIQITSLFGLPGLLLFAVPNALGLVGFGWGVHRLARREPGGRESLALYFERTPPAPAWVLYLYQVVALALTVFAAVRYGWMAMMGGGLAHAPVAVGLAIAVVVLAGALLGEFTGITKIKFSHGVFTLGLIACAWVLKSELDTGRDFAEPIRAVSGLPLAAYAVPLILGLLLGPWLDLQQWQRAIQMQREGVSVRSGFAVGAVVFFLLLLFRGEACEWVLRGDGAAAFFTRGWDGFSYAHGVVSRGASGLGGAAAWAEGVFVSLCALSTLDSGYVALRWFQEKSAMKNDHLLFALLPKPLVASPLPAFFLAGLVAWAGIALKWELEYFMVAYASFFVGYAALALANRRAANHTCLGLVAGFSAVVFALGYLGRLPWLMSLGAVLPLIHAATVARRREAIAEATPDSASVPVPQTKAEAHDLRGHFEDKVFVYTTVATYADTNSVGNVYFAMYSLYVGKTRELFFDALMPGFDPKTTPFYILTRDYQHRFLREAREFDPIAVKLRISGYNRKFCTLAHEIYGRDGVLLGDGEQRLLFVSSKNHELLDIPPEVVAAFIRYA